MVAKRKTKYVCQECGYESPKWMGKCPACNQWNTLTEELEPSRSKRHTIEKNDKTHHRPEKITEIESQEESRLTTSMKKFNRGLGAGSLPGSLVFIGGEPGIGKSKLLLHCYGQLAEKRLPVLYISGEETGIQSELRADRLGGSAD